MIRQATQADLDQVVQLAEAFHAYSPWREVSFDAPSTRAFAEGVVSSDEGVVFLSEGGFIAGALAPLWFNPEKRIAFELAWWAPKGGGRGLREAFEAWARDRGAFGVQCAALSDANLARVARIYGRAGFKQNEVAFVKRF